MEGRYFLDISYRGTSFHGWQIQSNAHTVQAEIQHAMDIVLQSKTDITGSGRTDTGVHALQQIAHADLRLPFTPAEFAYKLNTLLPPEISINSISAVKPEAHARFDAKKRTYR